MTEPRYDHRDKDQQAQDAAEPTLDGPVLEGARGLQQEATEAVASGDLETDPAPGGESLSQIADTPDQERPGTTDER